MTHKKIEMLERETWRLMHELNIATNVWTQSKNHETAEALIVAYEAYWDACDRYMLGLKRKNIINV